MKPIPFLRICLPFIGGILLADSLAVAWSVQMCWFTAALLLLLLSTALLVKPLKFLSFVLYDVFLVLMAFLLVSYHHHQASKQINPGFFNPELQQRYIATVNDIPVTKQSFVKCQLRMEAVWQNNQVIPYHTDVVAYIRHTNKRLPLKPGMVCVFETRLQQPVEPKNPGEFNYAQFLRHKHIYFTAYLNGVAITIDSSDRLKARSVMLYGLRLKYKILQRLQACHMQQNTIAICAALLTGYDDSISPNVVNAFAHSGTLHVLSVSGLHTGLIYMLLNYIFNLFDPQTKFTRIRFGLITAVLWFFALVTGFSAPVLRAVLMFNFLGMATLLKRRSPLLSVNILLLSAFLLLWYNPDYVYDVGFLLSYTAMLGIFIFAPPLLQAWQKDNVYLTYVIESAVVSIAATISTLPVTLYYFNQFPTWFMLCNLVVVPMSFVILLLAFLPVLSVMLLNPLIDALVQAMVAFIRFFDSGPYNYVANIPFDAWDGVFLTVFTWCAYRFLCEKAFRQVRAALLVLVAWQMYALGDAYAHKSLHLFAVYAVKGKHQCLVKNAGVATYNAIDSAVFQFSLQKQFTSFNHAVKVQRNFNSVQVGHEHVLILNKAGYMPLCPNLAVKKILLANNYRLRESDIQRWKLLNLVLADASNNPEINEQTALLCRKFGIRFYDVRKQGAYMLRLL